MKNLLPRTLVSLSAGIAAVVILVQRYRIEDLKDSLSTKERIIEEVLEPSLRDAYGKMTNAQLVEQIDIAVNRRQFNSIVSDIK